MTVRDKTKKALAALLPAGVLGISVALAALAVGQAESLTTERTGREQVGSVAERLSEIRAGISEIDVTQQTNPPSEEILLASWWNHGGWGWRNGGWGWHNGGWGNGGWHNWRNGGWGNGGGWHNWHNFWHNW